MGSVNGMGRQRRRKHKIIALACILAVLAAGCGAAGGEEDTGQAYLSPALQSRSTAQTGEACLALLRNRHLEANFARAFSSRGINRGTKSV